MISSVSEIWAAIITVLLAVILAYVLIVTTHEAQGEAAIYEPGQQSPYVTNPSPYDAHLTKLDREALDEAYKKYRTQLFESWLKDPTKQPERAIFGAEKARAVYLRVVTEIGKRPVQ